MERNSDSGTDMPAAGTSNRLWPSIIIQRSHLRLVMNTM